jgi:hypothetical protein
MGMSVSLQRSITGSFPVRFLFFPDNREVFYQKEDIGETFNLAIWILYESISYHKKIKEEEKNV